MIKKIYYTRFWNERDFGGELRKTQGFQGHWKLVFLLNAEKIVDDVEFSQRNIKKTFF